MASNCWWYCRCWMLFIGRQHFGSLNLMSLMWFTMVHFCLQVVNSLLPIRKSFITTRSKHCTFMVHDLFKLLPRKSSCPFLLEVVMIFVKYKSGECYYIFVFFPLYTRWKDYTTTDINKVVFISYGQDLWRLDLNTNVWEQLNLKGAPSPRSGHRMVFACLEVFLYLSECICGCKDECCC